MPPLLSRSATSRATPLLLLTGFEPFGGASSNPSQDIVRALDGKAVAGHRIAGAVLPCVFGTARRELNALLRRHRPAVLVCLGAVSSTHPSLPTTLRVRVLGRVAAYINKNA